MITSMRKTRGRLERRTLAISLAAGLIFLSATIAMGGSQQSALNPAGPQAGRIADLWWIFLGIAAPRSS